MIQRVATHLMFAGDGSAALELYAATFPQFVLEQVERYGAEQPGAEGWVKRADASFGGHYGFSQRFGWCTDRFGVSWQLNLK